MPAAVADVSVGAVAVEYVTFVNVSVPPETSSEVIAIPNSGQDPPRCVRPSRVTVTVCPVRLVVGLLPPRPPTVIEPTRVHVGVYSVAPLSAVAM